MLFNTLEFLLFFPVVLVLFYLLPHKYRWLLLLVASYYFYMGWNPAYVLLLVLTTTVDFYVANRMQDYADKKDRRPWLLLSLFFNIGLLMYFKYYNFFIDNINSLSDSGLRYMQFLLPVGISFYTFQEMGYVIDVYRGEIRAERHWGRFALFVSFFPQLVAGPIERAQNLMHQLKEKVVFDYHNFSVGGQHIIWGLFKKVVIADNIAVIVDSVYGNSDIFPWYWLLIATYLFAIQIYCDFSGYSDIAIGVARMLGVNLMVNFRTPYLSKGIREFWSRWHISLSTWFRAYLYVPLGGNRISKLRTSFNLFLVFIISGFWHGAAWTFIIWGALHGFYVLIELQLVKFKWWSRYIIQRRGLMHWFGVLILFHLVLLGWVFFRSESVEQATKILTDISTLSESTLTLPAEMARLGDIGILFKILLGVGFMFFDPYMNKIVESNHSRLSYSTKLFLYGFLIAFTMLFGFWGDVAFIYFQF
jgi:alginate O-acetyltransferase complex protein AlgI